MNRDALFLGSRRLSCTQNQTDSHRNRREGESICPYYGPNNLGRSGTLKRHSTDRQTRRQQVAADLSRRVLSALASDIERDGCFPRDSFDARVAVGLLSPSILERNGDAGEDAMT